MTKVQLDLFRPRLHQLVEVGWLDSASPCEIWNDHDYDFGDQDIWTIGYWVRKEEKAIILAQSWHPYGNHYRYGRLFYIPKGCITSLRKVE